MSWLPWALDRIERLRQNLAGQRGALVLAALGLVTGLAAGAVIVAFRATIELVQALVAPEGFVTLAPHLRLALPIIGTVIVIVLLAIVGRGRLRTGVVHVLERLGYNEGQLPMKNAVVQFSGGSVLLGFGLSLGQEGPGIHLGAASGSLLGQWFRIPHNSLRTMVACGVAAAIAAFFNTPLAGVVLAMEVVLMEYTIDGFIPVILAAVIGAALARMVYGDSPAFVVPPVSLQTLWELPYIVAMGIVIGALAAAFIAIIRVCSRAGRSWPWWLRMGVAGILVGACGLAVPQVMGIGYDTVNHVFAGQYAIGALAVIALMKLVATAIGVGARLPGGLIGPTLVIGAAAGGVLGHIGIGLVQTSTSDVSLYTMLGMGAMMGAVLQAPLAALLALLELTGNPHIILPGMLAIVSASLAAKELFRCDSVFAMQMRELGLSYASNPLAQQLRRIGVSAVMTRGFRISSRYATAEEATTLMDETPQWIIIEEGRDRTLLSAADLARFLESAPEGRLDLLALPGQRRALAPIHPQATLQAALEVLERNGVDALCVETGSAMSLSASRILGVVTREHIESTYRYQGTASASASNHQNPAP